MTLRPPRHHFDPPEDVEMPQRPRRPRRLKVYMWTGHRPGAGGRGQTREICAASSMVEVARIVGAKSPRALWNLGEIGNEETCAVALADPGVVFWLPYDESLRSGRSWRRSE